jgi:hypothetical protein
MTFREAIVRDSLGGRLPLHWRRRVARWHAWNRAQIRKLDRLHSGSHRRWIEWEYREFLATLFDPPRQPNKITITETP